MKEVAIVTDSTCDLPKEIIERHNIYVIPVQLIIKGVAYRDKELSRDEIYRILRNDMIKTSACLPEDALEVFKQCIDDGFDKALYIGLGSEFSSMMNTVSLCVASLDIDVTIYDSHGLSLLFGVLVEEAAKDTEHATMKERLQHLDGIRKRMVCRCIIKDLKYPIASGRLNPIAGKLASLMNIKPTMAIEADGNFHVLAKSRGMKKAYQRLLVDFRNAFEGKSIRLVTLRGIDRSIEEQFVRDVEHLVDLVDVFHGEAGVALSAHAGPDIFGYFAYEVEEF